MKPGDPVEVTNLDGETAEGTIETIHAETVAEYEIDFLDLDEATLFDYWRGADVDPDAPVVTVDLGGGSYDYPADRVRVLEEP